MSRIQQGKAIAGATVNLRNPSTAFRPHRANGWFRKLFLYQAFR